MAASLAMAIAPLASGSTVHTLRGEAFDVDTISHYKSGPGMTYSKLYYQSQTRSNKHFNVDVIDIDIAAARSGGLDLRMHLGKDSVHTSEKMTTVAQRHTDAQNQYLAAINGDFFITWANTPGMLGYPNMTACTGAQMALSDNVDHDNHVDAWIMDRNWGMWCDQTVLNNTVTLPDGKKATLYGVNFARRDDARRDAESDASDVVLYNEHRGFYTGSAAGWKEVTLALADGEQWGINSDVKLVVTKGVHTTGHAPIPRGGAVLAANTNAKIDLSKLNVGDVITLHIGLQLPSFDNLAPDVKEVVGGDVTLLRNGEAVLTANRFINSRDGEYPRTMVGYDKDRTHMIWCVVDGKTSSNTGCTYPQGAEMMAAMGCVDAVNFDGGGSTMMWLQKPGIVNTPSDGSERAVGSGLFAVLQAPADNEIAEIRFADWAVKSPQYGIYTPVIYGYNKYGQLLDMDVKNYTLSAPQALGQVTDDGLSVLTDGSGCHALTASYGSLTATVPVNVIVAQEVSFEASEMLIDNIREWPINTYAHVGNDMMPLAPQAMTWAVDNTSVATVDELGRVKGVTDGEATVTASVGDFTGIVKLTVECPTDKVMPLPQASDASAWKIAGGGTGTEVKANEQGLVVDYNITSARNPRLTLTANTPVRLWSIPDAITLTLESKGVDVTSITFNITPGSQRAVNVKVDNLKASAPNELTLNIADYFDATSPTTYPLTLNNIAMSMGGSGTGSLTLYDFATIYNGYSSVEQLPLQPGEGAIDPNTPCEYYNLQGIRVDSPQTGAIYIVRQGSRAYKVKL